MDDRFADEDGRYLVRHAEQQVREVSKSWPVVLVTGPRQCGKATMLKRLAQEENAGRTYVSLDDPSALIMAKRDPKLFFQMYRPPVLVDEIQYAPELFREVKRLVDNKEHGGDFWLTGSQLFPLMSGVQESLAGRVALIEMSTLSQREILGTENRPFVPGSDSLLAPAAPASALDVFERLWRGSMPGLISGRRKSRYVNYTTYLGTYLKRDVWDLSPAADALKFSEFMRAAAGRASQVLNYDSLAADADIRPSLAREWVRILETLGVVFLLRPYSNSLLKRTTRSPKLYFADMGLVCFLQRWPTPQTAFASAMNSALLENYAVSEIRKGYLNAGIEPWMYFYRDRDGREIDLIIDRDATLFPVAIRKSAMPDRRVFRAFEVLKKSGRQVGSGTVLCLADQPSSYGQDKLILPISAL